VDVRHPPDKYYDLKVPHLSKLSFFLMAVLQSKDCQPDIQQLQGWHGDARHGSSSLRKYHLHSWMNIGYSGWLTTSTLSLRDALAVNTDVGATTRKRSVALEPFAGETGHCWSAAARL
jgi:hypothetical protein